MRRVALLAVLVAVCQHGCSFIDVYGGIAVPDDIDATISVPGLVSGSVDIDLDTAAVVGARTGTYLDTGIFQPGFALDVSGVLTEADGLDVAFVPVSALVMARACLGRSESYPDGFLQPYVAAGPSLVIATLDEASLPGGSLDELALTVGADFRVGVSGVVVSQLGFELAPFVEYRFTYQSPDFDGDILGAPFELELDGLIHYWLFGVSFRF